MSRGGDFTVNRVPLASTEGGFVVHVTDPDSFFVQLNQSQDDLADLMAQIQDAYANHVNPGPGSWRLGDTCCALYEADEQWYRGRITGTPHNQDRVEVMFVDYGNKDYIEKTKVQTLLPQFLAPPVLSYRCCLEGVASPENFWTPEHVAQFEDLVLEKEFSVHFVSYDSSQDAYSVRLLDEMDGGKDVNKVFGGKTGSLVSQLSGASRTVRASDGLDMKITVTPQSAGGRPQSPAASARSGAPALSAGPGGGAHHSSLPRVNMKLGDKNEVNMSFVTTPSEFWVQLKKYNDATEKMIEDLAVAYNAMGPSDCLLINLRPGSACAAFSTADQTWYRATVERVAGTEATVFYLDYGNTETLPVINLKELKHEFRSLPAQGLLCALSGVSSANGTWSAQAVSLFEELAFDDEYHATVMGKDQAGKHHMSLVRCGDGQDVASLFKQRCPEAVKTEPAPSPPINMPEFARISLRTPNSQQVFLSWVENPGDFYVQLEENATVLDTLTAGLQEFYNSDKAEPLRQPRPGAMTVAKYSEDGMWYRGVVQNIAGATATVRFVDYGNSDTVSLDSLMAVDKMFSKIPAQAMRCSLVGVRPLSQGNTWGGDAKVFLESLTAEGAKCKFVENTGQLYNVSLLANGKDVTRELVALCVVRGETPESTARSPAYQFKPIGTGESVNVLVAYTVSVENFCVQLAENVEAIETLMAELQEFYDSNKGRPLPTPQVGMPCVAKYEEDGQWYRAQIRSFTARDVDVFFVDYGNTQTSSAASVMQCEDTFLNRLPSQALPCSLQLGSIRDMDAVTEKFSVFTGDGALEELLMVVRGREGSRHIVDLLKNGKSVTEYLGGTAAVPGTAGAPTMASAAPAASRSSAERTASGYESQAIGIGRTVAAFVSYIDSPAKFWIQLAGCEDELTSMMKSISDHYLNSQEPPLTNPSPGQPCVALYNVDRQYYRASIVSVHGSALKVQFVDYGNAELVDLANIRPISNTFLLSPLLAMEVCLDGFQNCPASDQLVEAFETLVLEQELAVTFKDTKNVVAKAGDVDLTQALQAKGFGPRGSKPTPKSPPSAAQPTLRQTPLSGGSGPTSPRGPTTGFGAASPKSPTTGFGATSPKSPTSGLGATSPRNSSSGSMLNSASAPAKYKEPSPPSGSAAALVTHLEPDSGNFYVQLLSCESQLEQLANKLQANYKSGGQDLREAVSRDTACVAKFTTDGCWYRAVVVNLEGPKAQVRFVDYGNTDAVPVRSLKAVTADLLEAPKQAFLCKLKGMQAWNKQIAQAFSSTALDEQLNVRFVSSTSPYEIQASINGQDLLQLMQKAPTSPPKPAFADSRPPRDSKASFGGDRGGDKSFGADRGGGRNDRNFGDRGFGSDRRDQGDRRDRGPRDFGNRPDRDSGSGPPPRNGGGSGGRSKSAVGEDWGDAPPSSNGTTDSGISRTPSPIKPVTTFPDQKFQRQEMPTSIEAAYVSYVTNDGTFYVQLVRDVEAIDEISEKVSSAPGARHPNPAVGAACGAVFSEDQVWYRGLINALSGSKADVLFVDFGNSDKCEMSSLKPLPASLLTPALAFQCQVEQTGLLTPEQQEAFRSTSLNQEYQVSFKPGTPYNVTISDSQGVDLATSLFLPTCIRLPVAPVETTQAEVSHVEENGRFYIQLNSRADALGVLWEELQTVGEGAEALTVFDVGQTCCAKAQDDEAWYRAVVTASSDTTATVHFVDYGNGEEVPKEAVKVLPPPYMLQPAFAYQCQLYGVNKWKPEQKDKFVAMTEGKVMNARFLTNTTPFSVELTLSIGLELLEDASPEAEEAGEDEFVDAQDVPHEEEEEEEATTETAPTEQQNSEIVKDDGEQPEEGAAADVEQPTVDEEQLTAVEQPAVGEQPPVDEKQQTLDEVQPTVDVEEPAVGEQAAAVEKTSNGEESNGDVPAKTNQEENQPAEENEPNTKIKTKAFPEQTPPALDACVVSHVDENGIFYIQLITDDESRDALSDRLQNECEKTNCQVPEPSVGLACCAKFSEDEAWYRAVVDSVEGEDVTVRFVDFGNADCVPASDLRELSAENKSLAPLAYCCVLEDCDPDTVSDKLEDQVVDQTLTVTFQTTEGSPFTVNLQLENGMDVCELLTNPVVETRSNTSVAAAPSDESAADPDRKCVTLNVGHRMKVTVSHMMTPSLFHVQRDDKLEEIEELSESMFEYFSNLDEKEGLISEPVVGQLYASLFGEDEDEDKTWYRVRVDSVDKDSCELFYVDYGNSDPADKSELRVLPDEYHLLPWQCVACSLSGVKCTEEDWSEEVSTALEELIAEKSLLAEVLGGDGIKTPYIVNLLDLGLPVAESLLSLQLPGVEAGENKTMASLHMTMASASESDKSGGSELDTSVRKLNFDDDEEVQEGAEIGEKEEVENAEKETVDDIGENEQEFSRQLQACTAQMESTLLDETIAASQKVEPAESTRVEEKSAEEEEDKEDDEEDEEFEDAVGVDQNGVGEEGENVLEENGVGLDMDSDDDLPNHHVEDDDEVQTVYTCVGDTLPELEWLDVHVCVAVSPTEFWCQLPSAHSILLGSTLGIEKARGKDTVRNVTVGNLYLVSDPPTANCRGKVLSTECEDPEKVLVLKLDYGTEEFVPKSTLYPLNKRQLDLPAQAFCCCLDEGESVTCSKDWLEKLISSGEAVDTDLQVKSVGRKPCGTVLVDVRVKPSSSSRANLCVSAITKEDDVETTHKVTSSGEVSMDALEISQPMLQSTVLGDTSQSRMDRSDGDKEYSNLLLDQGKEYQVKVLPGGKPDAFHITLLDNQGLLSALEDDIAAEVSEKGDAMIEALMPGTPCVVLEPTTQKWMRGLVKTADEQCKVICVDTGAVVKVDKSCVRELPTRLLDAAPQAVTCCLADITPVDEEWCDLALNLFKEFVEENDSLKLSVMGSGGDSYMVTLSVEESVSGGEITRNMLGGDRSINRMLVELGYAEAVAGSPLDLELQVDRTINEPSKMEEMENSFSEVSCQRKNSLGEESEEEENAEQDGDVLNASGDATTAFATESDEEASKRKIDDSDVTPTGPPTTADQTQDSTDREKIPPGHLHYIHELICGHTADESDFVDNQTALASVLETGVCAIDENVRECVAFGESVNEDVDVESLDSISVCPKVAGGDDGYVRQNGSVNGKVVSSEISTSEVFSADVHTNRGSVSLDESSVCDHFPDGRISITAGADDDEGLLEASSTSSSSVVARVLDTILDSVRGVSYGEGEGVESGVGMEESCVGLEEVVDVGDGAVEVGGWEDEGEEKKEEGWGEEDQLEQHDTSIDSRKQDSQSQEQETNFPEQETNLKQELEHAYASVPTQGDDNGNFIISGEIVHVGDGEGSPATLARKSYSAACQSHTGGNEEEFPGSLEKDPSLCELPPSLEESPFDSSGEKGEIVYHPVPSLKKCASLSLPPGDFDVLPAGTSSPRDRLVFPGVFLEMVQGTGGAEVTEQSYEVIGVNGVREGENVQATDTTDCQAATSLAREETEETLTPSSHPFQEKQHVLSPCASADLLEPQMTEAEMEQVAEQLEQMAVAELDRLEQEEAEEHREELSKMIDEYGNTMDVQAEKSPYSPDAEWPVGEVNDEEEDGEEEQGEDEEEAVIVVGEMIPIAEEVDVATHTEVDITTNTKPQEFPDMPCQAEESCGHSHTSADHSYRLWDVSQIPLPDSSDHSLEPEAFTETLASSPDADSTICPEKSEAEMGTCSQEGSED